MSHIDERIVKMTFDNSGFEKGIGKTLESLEKLNEVLKNTGNTDAVNSLSKSMKDIKGQLSTLNFDELDKLSQKQTIWQKFGSVLSNVGKGIGNIFSKLDIGGSVEKIASSFNKATDGSKGLESGVNAVSKSFSALGVVGATVLANVTNKMVNATTGLLKSLTIEPVMTGFSEYETKMGAIQTILTNTAHAGTTLEDVTAALNDLNTYADKTIYNFAEMTKNIGTFTAAGIDLDTSVEAIRGIANLAAASGSNSQQASTAMYQLSQALAAGKVSLADWNSVVNAGMGGKLFQDALIRTSEVLGTNAEDMIKKYGSFRESLTRGEWLTSEVLTETLKQLSGAYTEAELVAQGYTQSQARDIVELANNASAAATEVKTVTQLLDTMKESVQSGWAQSWEWIIGDKDEATELLTNISQGFENLIKPSMDARNEMLKFWNEAGGRNAVIKGFTNIVESVGKGLGAIKEAWQDVFPSMSGEKLVELSNKFRDFTEKIKMNDETAQKIKNTFKGVFDVFDMVKNAVVNVFNGFTPLGGVLSKLGGIVLSVTSGIGRFASNISEAVNKSKLFENIASVINGALVWIDDALTTAGNGISKFFDSMGKMDLGKAFGIIGKGLSGLFSAIKPLIDGLGEALGSFNFDTLFNILKSAAGIEILKQLKGMFAEVSDVAESAKGVFSSFKGFGSKVKEVLDGARESLEAWQQNLSAGTLMKLAGAIAILAGSLVMLASIKTEKLIPALGAMGGIFAELVIALAVIGKLGGFKGLLKTSGSLLAISTSILILSAALKSISDLKVGEMATGLFGMISMIGALGLAVKMFSKSSRGLKNTSASLVIFGVAMNVMASALKKLGEIDGETLGGGLTALAGVLIELGAFLAAAKYGNLSLTTAAGVLVLSAALLVLQHALGGFGNLNTDVILTGLAAMAGVLTEIAIFDKLSGSGLGMVATATGILAMSAAMLVMSASLKSLGSIKWEEMARGLVAMAGGLAILGVASSLISGGQMALLGVGIGIMSAALLLLSAAIQSMGSMSWEEIGKGLLVLAGSLTILAVAMYAMTGAVVGALAMVVMAGALALLTPQLILLGQMDLAGVGIMLLALAGAFTVIGVAGLLLTPVVPTLILLAAAIALLGVGCVACGAGLTAVGTGLGLIGAAVGGSGLLIVEFIRQLINLLPQLGTKAVEAFANFVGGLTSAVPQLITGFTAIITAMLTSIGTLIPQIVQTGLDIAVAFAQGLATAVPQLVTAGMELILGVLEGIASNIGRIITAGADIIVNFLDGIASALPRVIQSGINLALSFIEGVADGLNNNQGRLEAAIRNIITALINAGIAVIRGGISGFASGGKALLQGLVNGIKSMMSAAGSAVKSCINAAKRAASNLGSALIGAGKSLIQGLVSGIKSAATSVANAAKNVVQGAINAAKSALKINSPSKVFIEIGKYTSEGFAVGLDKYSKHASDSATNLANGVINTVKDPMSNLAKMINSEMGGINSTPTITPVMDLTNIQAGTKRLDSMLQDGTMAINTTSGKLAGTVGRIQNRNDNSDILSALKDLQNSMKDNRGNTYQINGITYDDGSNIKNAIETLIRATIMERRV